MKHLFVFLLSAADDNKTIRGRVTVRTNPTLTAEQQRDRLDAFVAAMRRAGIVASPKLPEPHR